MAECLLERPVRRALDIGCGEGRWCGALRAVRPRIDYLGVDPSEYAVGRFGRSRRILHGKLEELAALKLGEAFDLVICADVLHYLPAAEVTAGLRQLVPLVRGVAYLEVFTSEDGFDGDRVSWQRRTAGWYRRTFQRAGLVPLGMHCYAPPPLHSTVAVLERGI